MILVSGATGLVGSHLLYQLSQTGVPIRAIYRNADKIAHTRKVFSYYSDTPAALFDAIEWFEADLLDLPKLSKAFANITKVYHCAAFISFDPKDYQKLRNVNIKGTANIVNLCIEFQVKKLCYVSSIASLGSQAEIIDEETERNSNADHSVYAISKYGAEMEVWRGMEEGVAAVIVNPGIIIGPGFWKSGSGRLIPQAYKGLPYYLGGSSGFVGVMDVVRAMHLLMESEANRSRFIITASTLSFEKFSKMLSTALGSKPPKKEISRVGLEIGWRLDWLRQKISGKHRRLSKNFARTSHLKLAYSNQKLRDYLEDFHFTPMAEVIQKTTAIYLEEVGKP